MSSVVDFPELRRATGYKRVGDVARCLERQGIRFFDGKDGLIWTTTDLMARAKGFRGGDAAENAPKLPIGYFG